MFFSSSTIPGKPVISTSTGPTFDQFSALVDDQLEVSFSIPQRIDTATGINFCWFSGNPNLVAMATSLEVLVSQDPYYGITVRV